MAIYLELEGIKGNVTAEGYEEQIAIESFAFGVSRGVSMTAGTMANREVDKPNLSPIQLSKVADNSVAELFKLSTTGSKGIKATLHFVQTGTDKFNEFMSYELEDVLITGYSVSSGGDRPMESLELSYAKIQVSYTDADSAGKAGGPLRAGYDLRVGKPV